MKKLVAFLMFIAVLAPAVQADEFDEKITRLLALTHSIEPTLKGMDKMLQSLTPMMAEQMFNRYVKEGRNITRQEVDELITTWRERFIDRVEVELVPMMVAEYRKFLSEEDLDKLLILMEKPIFQRYASMTPAIMELAQQAGEELGGRLGAELMNELMAENPKFK